MTLLDFNTHSNLRRFDSGWRNLDLNGLNEGIRMDGSRIVVDFEKDLEKDVVLLEDPKPLNIVKKEKVPVFRGYRLEKASPDLATFMKDVKKWGAMDKETLKTLIDFTYPEELKSARITLIFITGSSDPLAAHIAEALIEMYYPEAEVVDVLKKYYGTDLESIIDWDKYKEADAKTREMADTYLRQFSRRGSIQNKPRVEFEGYIKKSLGAQSGMRKLLKKGHEIDDYIISKIIKEEQKWIQEYRNNPNILDNVKVKFYPTYLFVDDTIIEGSTMRGIFKELKDTLASYASQKKLSQMALNNILGYCLFSYKG